MLEKMMLKHLMKRDAKRFKRKIAGVEAIKVKPEDQMYLELIVSVAILAGVEPGDLAKQVLRKERFSWFMNRMTIAQLEETKKMVEKLGDDELTNEVEEISEMLKKEVSKNDSKANKKNK